MRLAVTKKVTLFILTPFILTPLFLPVLIIRSYSEACSTCKLVSNDAAFRLDKLLFLYLGSESNFGICFKSLKDWNALTLNVKIFHMLAQTFFLCLASCSWTTWMSKFEDFNWEFPKMDFEWNTVLDCLKKILEAEKKNAATRELLFLLIMI